MQTLTQWHQQGAYFKYRKHTIFYQEIPSEKPLLVLLHGFPTASWDWWKIWPALSQHFHLLAPDFIGFGFSDKPRNYQYSLVDQTDLVQELLSQKKINEYHILAHDYGVSVAQELLARQLEAKNTSKDSIQSVCFLNGGLFPAAHQPRPIQKALISPIGFLLTPFLSRAMLAKNFAQIFGPETQASDQEIDEFFSLIQEKGGKYIFHKLIRYMADRKQFADRWKSALLKSKMPMRLINGPEDPVSGRHLAEHYQKIIPKADVVLLDKIGHYPQTEAPELVIKHFLAFHQ
ncbi:MAG: alpha/beta hydrolase [Saprospiraceae bacterium]